MTKDLVEKCEVRDETGNKILGEEKCLDEADSEADSEFNARWRSHEDLSIEADLTALINLLITDDLSA